MSRLNFPDPGTHITVTTNTGGTYSGYVAEPHVFVNNEWLCLVSDPPPETETRFAYVRCREIVAWVWDCRP